jgi:heme/copper-type cytochrome/quinol oxidase subunit 2
MVNPTSNFFLVFLVIGGFFGFLAALMAYLITYNEWMHHYSTKKEPRKMALEIAVFTFVFFIAIAIIAGFFLK